MARNKRVKHQEHEEEIWHVVYLDFMTTMMILFMSMWAANQVSQSKGREANSNIMKQNFSGKTFAPGAAQILPELQQQISKFLAKENQEGLSKAYASFGYDENNVRQTMIINGHASKNKSGSVLQNQTKNMALSVNRALSVYNHVVNVLSKEFPDPKALEKVIGNISVCGHSYNDPVRNLSDAEISKMSNDAISKMNSDNQRVGFEVKWNFPDEKDSD